MVKGSPASHKMSTASPSEPLRYLCVLDFEATCWDRSDEHEVIEFPTVVIDIQEGKILDDRFRVFVKPAKNPVVSEFCFGLTGITQAQVDAGIPFPEALRQHGAFIDKYRPCCLVCSGDWDLKTMLPIESRIHGIQPSGTYRRWINIKRPFADLYRTRGGMAQMLQHLKLDLLGRHHSGIDDCVNIARIALRMLEDGWQPRPTTE